MPRHRNMTKKVQDRVGRIFEDIQQQKPIAQIAMEQGVTERTIQYNMATPEFQMRAAAMAIELSKKIPEMIKTFWDSDDPQDRRKAGDMAVQLYKTFAPRIVQETTRSATWGISDETQVFGDIFDNLTPEQQAPIIDAYKNRQVPRMVDSESKVIDMIPKGDNENNG
jgi:hypothetical protein